ncbi:MAG: alanine racemase [Hyphomicrobiales bacterium]
MSDRDDQTYRSADYAGATLTVDLGALRDNYLKLKAAAGGAECAAAVKGEAYGTGAVAVTRTLAAAGCGVFFVAQLSEAAAIRPTLGAAALYVLNGLVPGSCAAFEALDARPVLGNLEEIEEWAAFCRAHGTRLKAALHVDTGINRLGLGVDEVDALARAPALLADFECTLVMSHLACADEPDHPMNREQVARFDALRARLPAAPASLANSGGTLNGGAYHYDMVRPGVALYGGNPLAHAPNPMDHVVTLEARVMQVRDVAQGTAVGYGATWTAQRRSRIALVPVGYYDGFFRALSTTNAQGEARVWIAGRFAPVVGRVSMDMITVDVTDIPAEGVRRGTTVELIGPHISIDDVARWAGTIPYEVLTSLGQRYARTYKDAEPE